MLLAKVIDEIRTPRKTKTALIYAVPLMDELSRYIDLDSSLEEDSKRIRKGTIAEFLRYLMITREE